MLEPLPCVAGSYCPEGSVEAVPCPEGYYSSGTDLFEASQCELCDKGHACPAASTSQNPCTKGTYQSERGQGECLECLTGKYANELASEECFVCGAGNYSSNVLSCLPCPVGECRSRVAPRVPSQWPACGLLACLPRTRPLHALLA